MVGGWSQINVSVVEQDRSGKVPSYALCIFNYNANNRDQKQPGDHYVLHTAIVSLPHRLEAEIGQLAI